VEARAGFRPDIEGLRGVAVLLVVLGHLTGWPRGGFIGVDVFFVISGYLITGLLVGERERTGGLSLPRFYLRRARGRTRRSSTRAGRSASWPTCTSRRSAPTTSR
jgi:peptidoglycan/LPS O-acetylase OafA/YrhL